MHINDVSTLSSTSIVIDAPFLPSSLPRLEKIAETFQRVKYHKLRFRISPQISTATSGGYVAAFIADVSDQYTNSEHGLSKLTSQYGSRTCKWWEDTTLTALCPPDLFYTSQSLTEPRSNAPGKFILAVDGKASQSGALTVYVDWDATFSGPSLEEDVPSGVIPTLQRALFFKAGSDGIYVRTAKDTYNQDIRKALPGAQPGIYRFNGMRYMGKNEANAFTGIEGFNKMSVDSNFHAYPHDIDGQLSYNSFHSTMVADVGENLDYQETQVFRPRGLQYLCQYQQSTRSENISPSLSLTSLEIL